MNKKVWGAAANILVVLGFILIFIAFIEISAFDLFGALTVNIAFFGFMGFFCAVIGILIHVVFKTNQYLEERSECEEIYRLKAEVLQLRREKASLEHELVVERIDRKDEVKKHIGAELDHLLEQATDPVTRALLLERKVQFMQGEEQATKGKKKK